MALSASAVQQCSDGVGRKLEIDTSAKGRMEDKNTQTQEEQQRGNS
jgi:hypothetical protein